MRVILVVLLLAASTVVLTVAARDTAYHEARDGQHKRLDAATSALASTLRAPITRTEDMAALLTAAPQDRAGQAWERMRRRLFADPALFGAGYALSFGEERRAAVERGLGRPLQEPDASGALQPARRRPWYVVPVHADYRDGSHAGLGVNLAAEPRRAATLLRAALSDGGQLTSPVRLVGSRAQAVVIYTPAPGRGTRGRATDGVAGFVIASYRTRRLMDRVRAVLERDIGLRVTDGGTVFDGSSPTLEHPRSATVPIDGRRLRIAVSRPAVDLGRAWATAIGGIALTLLVATLFARTMLAEVRARSAEAAQARRAQRVQSQFVAAFEQAPIGIALLDVDGTVRRVNEALCRLTGYPAADLRDRALREFTPLAHHDRLERMLALLPTAGRQSIEQQLIAADGTLRWVVTSATPLREDDGAIRSLLLQFHDISERRAYEERLQHLASHDPLTGLLNRRAFFESLEHQVALSRRYDAGGAVLVVDLDHFKAVNDTLGHTAGDRVLADVARRLSVRLRESDVLARLGGDEFAVLLPAVGADAATAVAENLIAVVRDVPVPQAVAQHRLDASIGIAMIHGTPELTGDELLTRADLALYAAKDAGRGRAAVHGAGDPPPAQRNVASGRPQSGSEAGGSTR